MVTIATRHSDSGLVSGVHGTSPMSGMGVLAAKSRIGWSLTALRPITSTAGAFGPPLTQRVWPEQ